MALLRYGVAVELRSNSLRDRYATLTGFEPVFPP